MSATELLNELLHEIEEFKKVGDIKNDTSHHINFIISYFKMLQINHQGTNEYESAKKVLLSIKDTYPSLSTWCDNLVSNKKQELDKKQGLNNLIKLISVASKEYKEHEKGGMIDEDASKKYVETISDYLSVLDSFQGAMSKENYELFKSKLQMEINRVTAKIEYMESLDKEHEI